MTVAPNSSVRALLLRRRGRAYLSSLGGGVASEAAVRGLELELAELGYLLSTRLRGRLETASLDELLAFRSFCTQALQAHKGAAQSHTPLFRNFPHDVPSDTGARWWAKVLVHFLQAQDQPCVFCRRGGTTHVLNPCAHVVCDHCFDGANFSACPVCERHVDRSAPFFKATPVRGLPVEARIRFELLDLGEDEQADARAWFLALCGRTQALSVDDRTALQTLVEEHRGQILDWVPDRIPVRENVALVFGTLFKVSDPERVLPVARHHLKTATDVLRFLAVLAGTDGSLQPELAAVLLNGEDSARRFCPPAAPAPPRSQVNIKKRRFRVPPLSRALRRTLLALLEAMNPIALVEDLLRHRSYWVWLGEFLHPHEYAARFPNVARAFQIVRQKGPDGVPAPEHRTWRSQVEETIDRRDLSGLLPLLEQRPGELARRLDQLLRMAGLDPAEQGRVLTAFTGKLPAYSTPVLATLHAHLGARGEVAPVRVYWPKGAVATGVSAPDRRAVLPAAVTELARAGIEGELLARFGRQSKFEIGLIDEGLKSIIVPFNERTASSSAVVLPRGSRVAMPRTEWVRLFLHWCEPERDGRSTDLDLSVAFYSETWVHRGDCSFYQLELRGRNGQQLARSAGDLQDGPWPEGASEFVDIRCSEARLEGARYAVMVVNNYHGMAFSRLERAFAGLMFRDDELGQHFDPRTVEHKFAVVGDNGVFLPLVLDLQEATLHWLDVQSKGSLNFNTAATSSRAITRICPDLMAYFQSGTRMNMHTLALLHAAARCEQVLLRGDGVQQFVRGEDESRSHFLDRLRRGAADEPRAQLQLSSPTLAFLREGDLELPEGSQSYALARGRVVPTLGASDFLS